MNNVTQITDSTRTAASNAQMRVKQLNDRLKAVRESMKKIQSIADLVGPGGRLHPDARGTAMHAFGEHVLIEDCVTAAKIYLAVALDLCSRKAA